MGSIHTPSPRVAILLCTCHGELYVREQLDSIFTQTYTNWTLWISDDGSTDETHTIIQQYQDRANPGQIHLLKGPQQGFAANFFSLLFNEDIQADYYAYADQDDVWDRDRLERGIQALKSTEQGLPGLYCTRTRLIDAHTKLIGLSKHYKHKPDFKNAIVQSIAGGNTMLFNRMARELLLKTKGAQLGFHDWWTYIVVSGCGGRVIYDPKPSLSYRQHSANEVGANTTFGAMLKRVFMLFQGRFKKWNGLHVTALQNLRPLLTATNQKVVDSFAQARTASFWARIKSLKKSGVYRQTRLENLALIIATCLKKI
jgi:glycosyltransferase involved in cell wall biosynthesis